MLRLKSVAHHDRDLKQDPTFMCACVTTLAVTEVASASASTYVGHSMDVFTKMLCQRSQIWMTLREMLPNRSGCNAAMTKSAMISYFIDQRSVQQESRNGLVAQMHFEIWSVDDRHNGLLGRIK